MLVFIFEFGPPTTDAATGTAVTISGKGFLQPVTQDQKVLIRWEVKSPSSQFFTSKGRVEIIMVNGAESAIIRTSTPSATSSIITNEGTGKVFLRVSFDGFTFTPISFSAFVVFYLTPEFRSLYALDTRYNRYPIAVPHPCTPLGAAYPEYQSTLSVPQSGTVYDRALKADVQLYLYVQAKNILLSPTTTACIFLMDAKGDETDIPLFDGCLLNQRYVNYLVSIRSRSRHVG